MDASEKPTRATHVIKPEERDRVYRAIADMRGRSVSEALVQEFIQGEIEIHGVPKVGRAP